MAPSQQEPNQRDVTISVITTVGVIAGLSGLAAVIAGGYITANAVRTGLQQVPIESPVPLEAPLNQ